MIAINNHNQQPDQPGDSGDGAPRPPVITKPEKRAMLRAISQTGNITMSARMASIARETHYAWLEKDPVYARAFDDAMQRYIEALEEEVDRRARFGIERVKTYKGAVIMVPSDLKDPNSPLVPLVEREYSDVLLIFRLKALRPDKYRDNHAVEVSGSVNIFDSLYPPVRQSEAEKCLPAPQPSKS